MADNQDTETPVAAEQTEQPEAVEETPAAEPPVEAAADAAVTNEGETKTAEDAPQTGESTEQPSEEVGETEGEKPAEGEQEVAPEGEAETKEGETTQAGEETAAEGGETEGATAEQEGDKPETPAAAEGTQPEGSEEPKQEGEESKDGEAEAAPVTDGEAGADKEGDNAEEAPPEGEQAPAEAGEGQTETPAEGEGAPVDGEQADTPREGDSKSPLPQSDTFAEGERPESALGVGEKLSREGTPTLDVGESLHPDMLEPTTPERMASPDQGEEHQHMVVYEEDEEEEEPEFDRDLLIEKYHAALAQREQLQSQNYQLQHKLAEYFRKKKADERQDYDKNLADQEQRYLKYMAQLEELRRQDAHERETSQLQIEELKDRCEDKKERVDDERNKFMEFRKQVALNSINSRSGKPIPPKDIEQYLSLANRKEGEVVQVRLENIKLKNKLKKKEQQLKSKEELAEGLHLIDFEQLKIENQTYNEKIEERNEELLKLRKKITSTVQVLTHLKEKLQFVYAENHDQKGKLKDVEAFVAQRRDILSRTKQARDSLRIDNQRLRQNCGLLGNESLLRDFEERKDESDDLKDQLENLKMQHAELTLNCNQVRRKLDQARTGGRQ